MDIEDRAEKERDGGLSDDILADEDCRRRKGEEREGKRYVAKEGRRSCDMFSRITSKYLVGNKDGYASWIAISRERQRV